jgi:hypothetical protein
VASADDYGMRAAKSLRTFGGGVSVVNLTGRPTYHLATRAAVFADQVDNSNKSETMASSCRRAEVAETVGNSSSEGTHSGHPQFSGEFAIWFFSPSS